MNPMQARVIGCRWPVCVISSSQLPARSTKGSALSPRFSGSRRSRKADKSISGLGPPVRRRTAHPSLASAQYRLEQRIGGVRPRVLADPGQSGRLQTNSDRRLQSKQACAANLPGRAANDRPAHLHGRRHGQGAQQRLLLRFASHRLQRLHAVLPLARAAGSLPRLRSDRAGTFRF